jgi:hypothetical protein
VTRQLDSIAVSYDGVKDFWRVQEVCFSAVEGVLPVNRSFFFGTSPPISSTNSGDVHSKENLRTPSSVSTTSLEMAMGTRNPSTQWVLPDKEMV